jgi:hypothetical protein
MDSPQQTLQAIQRRLHDKFSPSALAEYEAEKQEVRMTTVLRHF